MNSRNDVTLLTLGSLSSPFLLSEQVRENSVTAIPVKASKKKKTKKSALLHRCKAAACTSLTLCFFLLITILVGAEIEKKAVNAAPSTDIYYDTPHVCASANFSASSSSNPLNTFANVSAAHGKRSSRKKNLVAHCGSCGYCSTVNDIHIYEETKETLTKTSTRW
jgi:hypothetical protein